MRRQQVSAATAEGALEKGLRRRWRPGEKLIEVGIFLASLLAIVVLLGIVAFC
jgi:hypothetical protein